MKKIYIVMASLAFSAALFAQTQDSLLRRQLEVERDFNPTLLDADKINSLPALREPVVQKANTNFSTWAGRTTPPLEITLPSPAGIMTEIPYNLKKGYLSLHAGNYANVDGAFGYRLVEQPKDNLSFSFLHNSSNGNIDYLQLNSTSPNNSAYFMDNLGKLAYQHNADALLLDLQFSYLHSGFNYYGNSFEQNRYFENEKQRIGVFNAHLGLASKESDYLNFRGSVDFKNFSTKYGYFLQGDPIKGNEINVNVGFDKPFQNNNSKVGVNGTLFSTTYSNNFENYFLLNGAPFILFNGENRSARLGADVLIQNADKVRFRVVPNVKLQLGLTNKTSLYANIHGGFQHNTFLEMISESRYFLHDAAVKPSFSIIDIDGGVKIGDAEGFRIDLFGGYRKTEDAHFLVHHGQEVIDDDSLGEFREVLSPVYGNLSHSHIGGLIQTNIWTQLDLSLRLKKNFYKVDNMMIDNVAIAEPRAYNKPGLEVDLRASLDIMEQLKFTFNYYFAGDRWSRYKGIDQEMDNINDLNLGGVYSINDAFSLNLRVNNLLSQKYDIWYGHPAQGLNVSGGFSFTF
jgi:hypothetical protein